MLTGIDGTGIWQRICRYSEELWIALFGWIPTPAGMLLRLLAWRYFFQKCGSVRFGTGLSIINMKKIGLGDRCRLGRLSFLTANNGSIEIGDDVAISPCVHVGGDNGSIYIGKNVAIGPGTVIRAANHRFGDSNVPIMHQGHEHGEIIIDDDVWIGANCVILPDVKIGRGAIIGAGAVVTRNVAPYAVAAGVPARQIATRSAKHAQS